MSIAFRPFPKDEGKLSVYDGDLIEPKSSWVHYTDTLGFQSAGVWAVSKTEVEASGLTAGPDTEGQFAEHAIIDFRSQGEKEQKAKSKILAAKAQERGCLYSPPAE